MNDKNKTVNFGLFALKPDKTVEEIKEFFEKFNTTCNVTDFAKLLGYYSTKEKPSWWTANYYNERFKELILISEGNDNYNLFADSMSERHYGYRPTFCIDDIQKTDYTIVNENDDSMIILYGEYPQNKVSEMENIVLEQTYDSLKDVYLDGSQKIQITGNYYTTDNFPIVFMRFLSHDECVDFYERKHVEYEYDNKKYIRFVGDYNVYCSNHDSSLNEYFEKNKPYWIKVEPITWLVDKKTRIAISKDILLSNIPVENIYNFFVNYFAKQINQQPINHELLTINFIEEYYYPEYNRRALSRLIETALENINKTKDMDKSLMAEDEFLFERRLIKIRNEIRRH